jgi:hypothetical protein
MSKAMTKVTKRKAVAKGRAKKSAPPKKMRTPGHQEVGLLIGFATKMKLLIDDVLDADDLQDWLRTGQVQIDWKRNTLIGPDGRRIGTFEIVRATIRDVSTDL